MKTKTILASIAMAGLALAQPAAAATRSFESLPATGLELGSVERSGSLMGEEEGIGTTIGPWVVIGVLVVAGALILVLSSGKSPG